MTGNRIAALIVLAALAGPCAAARADAEDRRTRPRRTTCASSATTTSRRVAPISRPSITRATAGSPTSATTAARQRRLKPLNPLTGQEEFNGTSIVDVTDPAHPKYLAHVPGLEGLYEQGGAQMVRVCDGKTLPKGDPNAVYMLRVFGSRAHEMWNVTDPAQPGVDHPHRRGPQRHP